MVRKLTTSPQTAASALSEAAAAWPDEVAGLLGDVQCMLDADRAAEALDRIARSKIRSPWLSNAAAVCQLRLGNARTAVDVLHRLVVAGGLFLRADAPVAFKVNFATALIADGNLSGGLRTLDEIRDEGNPVVQEIRDAVRRWEAEMTLGRRLWYVLGGRPHRPFVPDFPLGRLG
jgi:hypothetical protein